MQRSYRLMGIVNVTPDSFSDGGEHLEASAAVAHGLELAHQGADILDVGGESTRPGAEPVGAAEELRRVVPVVEGLVAASARTEDGALPGGLADQQHPPLRHPPSGEQVPFQISIDTSKAIVARAALAAGASLVNDVTALRGDPEMAEVIAAAGCDCCLMHMRGEPRTMQRDIAKSSYGDVVGEVRGFLEERLEHAVAAGVAEERIMLDPGIGFGKTREHNFELLARLDELVALGRPVLIGTSRKSFLALARPRLPVADGPAAPAASHPPLAGASANGSGGDRLPGTIATNVLALERGASVFRVHDVAAVAAALATAAATLAGTWTARRGATS